MFIAKKLRQLADEYGSLSRLSDKALEIAKFRELQRNSTKSAEIEERLHGIYERTLDPGASNELNSLELAKEEEHVLRCLGAALLMQWNSLPTGVQRELFDKAGAMAEMRDTAALRGQIARFLHRHKDFSTGEPVPQSSGLARNARAPDENGQ